MSTPLNLNPDISIVIPVFFNEGTLVETMSRIKRDVFAVNPGYSFEIIFVDDGSGDGSMNELLRIYEENAPFAKIIKLTRNFGQVNALLAGFHYAQGKCVVAISADGQDPPSLINEMIHYHFEEHYEIVVCSRRSRDESLYRSGTSRFFYWLMRKLSFPHMPSRGFDFVLLGRRALDLLLMQKETTPFFQGQILWMGFNTKFIEYHRLKRRVGRSQWTLGKRLTYLIDGVINYSFFPIRLMSLLGILIAMIGGAYAAVIVISMLMWGNPVKGWAPIMITILLIGGFQMLMLGIIGEYLWRTLSQARSRPAYIVERVYGGPRETWEVEE